MVSKRRHGLLLFFPLCFPTRFVVCLAKVLPGKIGERVEEICTDWFLRIFLWVFGLSFRLFADLRKNIEDFEAIYVFKTPKGSVEESAIFKRDENGHPRMTRGDGKAKNPNVTIVFKNVKVFKLYLYSLADQDILELILDNDVELDGNWNYVCKFLFMIRDLRFTVGLDQ